MKECSRIDVLRNLPRLTQNSFIIMMDDVNRHGEHNCFIKMMDVLSSNGVECCHGEYVGEKTVAVIAT